MAGSSDDRQAPDPPRSWLNDWLGIPEGATSEEINAIAERYRQESQHTFPGSSALSLPRSGTNIYSAFNLPPNTVGQSLVGVRPLDLLPQSVTGQGDGIGHTTGTITSSPYSTIPPQTAHPAASTTTITPSPYSTIPPQNVQQAAPGPSNTESNQPHGRRRLAPTQSSEALATQFGTAPHGGLPGVAGHYRRAAPHAPSFSSAFTAWPTQTFGPSSVPRYTFSNSPDKGIETSGLAEQPDHSSSSRPPTDTPSSGLNTQQPDQVASGGQIASRGQSASRGRSATRGRASTRGRAATRGQVTNRGRAATRGRTASRGRSALRNQSTTRRSPAPRELRYRRRTACEAASDFLRSLYDPNYTYESSSESSSEGSPEACPESQGATPSKAPDAAVDASRRIVQPRTRTSRATQHQDTSPQLSSRPSFDTRARQQARGSSSGNLPSFTNQQSLSQINFNSSAVPTGYTQQPAYPLNAYISPYSTPTEGAFAHPGHGSATQPSRAIPTAHTRREFAPQGLHSAGSLSSNSESSNVYQNHSPATPHSYRHGGLPAVSAIPDLSRTGIVFNTNMFQSGGTRLPLQYGSQDQVDEHAQGGLMFASAHPEPDPYANQRVVLDYKDFYAPVILYEIVPETTKCYFAQSWLENVTARNPPCSSLLPADAPEPHINKRFYHGTEGFISTGNALSLLVVHNATNPWMEADPNAEFDLWLDGTTTIGTYGYHWFKDDWVHWTTSTPCLKDWINTMEKAGYIKKIREWRPDMKASERRFHKAYWVAANRGALGNLLRRAPVDGEDPHGVEDDEIPEINMDDLDDDCGYTSEWDERSASKVFYRVMLLGEANMEHNVLGDPEESLYEQLHENDLLVKEGDRREEAYLEEERKKYPDNPYR